MNKHESEDVTARSGGMKKRKKFVFLDKFEEYKTATNKRILKLWIAYILQVLLTIILCGLK